MRILIVHPGPDFSVADVYAGWAEGLREAGAEVALFNMNDRLVFYSRALMNSGETDEDGYPIVRQAMSEEAAVTMAMQGISHACFTFWPDAVLFVSGFFITAGVYELLRMRRMKTVLLATESPYEDTEQLVRAPFMDLVLLNDPTNLTAFREHAQALYMPHAYRPAVHYPRTGPRDPELASDLCFIGTAFKSRAEFFGAMAPGLAGLNVLLAGNGWGKLDEANAAAGSVATGLGEPDCVENERTAQLYRNAKCGINFYRREHDGDHGGQGWAMGPREVEMAACGLFFLRDPRPESDDVFGSVLPAFAGPEDAAEQVRWWAGHDPEREDAARRARSLAAERTFAGNARRLLAALDSL